MKIETFLLSLKLPKKYYDSNFNISEKYFDEATAFIKGLKRINGTEFEDKNKQKQIKESMGLLIPVAQKNIQRILNIFLFYENSNPKKAQEEFDSMMDSLKDIMFISTIDDLNVIEPSKGKKYTRFRIREGEYFYRVRGVNEKNEYIESNPDELFHIPLTKKSLTNNERFSLAGFPSLYLSSMLPLAWQESGYPQRYYYSEYQYLKLSDSKRNLDEELKILALYSPKEIYIRGVAEKYNDFDFWLNSIYRCLMMYPLVMACSFVNHSGKGAYKQEYVIPQMLMQWVLRNKEIVQGISYFTCVDISMMQREYCAYNVVIPAMEPYDSKKYSQKLRNDFTWTVPQYFENPLFDSEYNRKDKEVLYQYINKIRTLYNFEPPQPFTDYLDNIERICTSLYYVMQRGDGTDMQMIIHLLELIKGYYNIIKQQSVEKIIADVQREDNFLLEDKFYIACEQLREISKDFLVIERGKNNIAEIIERYQHIVWNDFHHKTLIEIVYKKDGETQGIENWCHENNLLFRKRLILESDEEKFGKSISEIKTPLVQRINSISIYDKKEWAQVDYIREKFDPELHGDEILGN